MIASDGYTSSMAREHGFETLRVEGELPEALSGTLFRVAPGLFESHGRPYDHPFEGDGAVCAIRFQRGEVFNFGIRYGPQPMLTLYELPPSGRARVVANLPFDNLMLHDFALAPRHAVFFVSPTPLSLPRSFLGLRPFDELIGWEPERGTEVIVVPLDDPSATRRFSVDAFYQWHFVGAFERGDELVVDAVTYPDFASFEELGEGEIEEPGRLTRVVVDREGQRLHREPLADLRCEFPRIDPRVEGSADYDRVWLLADEGDREGIAEVDLTTGTQRVHRFEPGQHVSEPVFVPRNATAPQGDGWLLGLVYDRARHQSHVAVLDTRRLEDEPVARVHFDHHVPMTFHGIWEDG